MTLDRFQYELREARRENFERLRDEWARVGQPSEPEPTKPPRFAYVVKVTVIDTVARESATFLDTMDGRAAMAEWKAKQESKT